MSSEMLPSSNAANAGGDVQPAERIQTRAANEPADDLLDAKPGDPPPERARAWAEPQDEPIMDAARVPLRSFRDNQPESKALANYLWLHFVRPFLLVVFWIGVAFYAWLHFFQPTEQLGDLELLGIYALIVLGIFLVMLVLAPLRRRVQQDEEKTEHVSDSTMAQIADYAELPQQRLSGWQSARRLSVRHDDSGRLTDAADLDTEAALLEPPAVVKRKSKR